MNRHKKQRAEPPDQGWGKRAVFVRTCLAFLALAAAFPFLIFYLPVDLLPFQVLTARITAAVLSASGLTTIREGINLRLPHANWDISIECTAIFALIVYAAFVLAYQASLRAKFVGLAVGLPFIVLINILRLLVLAWATEFAPGLTKGFHDYGWQVIFLIVVAVMWLAWIELCVCREKKADLPR